jgi:hypothetical protein
MPSRIEFEGGAFSSSGSGTVLDLTLAVALFETLLNHKLESITSVDT